MEEWWLVKNVQIKNIEPLFKIRMLSYCVHRLWIKTEQRFRRWRSLSKPYTTLGKVQCILCGLKPSFCCQSCSWCLQKSALHGHFGFHIFWRGKILKFNRMQMLNGWPFLLMFSFFTRQVTYCHCLGMVPLNRRESMPDENGISEDNFLGRKVVEPGSFLSVCPPAF